MAGLSSKIKGLRFMQRALDKAAKDKGDVAGTRHIGDTIDKVLIDDAEGRERGAATSDAWIAGAATSRCVVLRGDEGQPGSNEQRKGRLAFGKTQVDVESEQIRTVTEQMESSRGDSRNVDDDEPTGVGKKPKRRQVKATKKSSKKRRV